jgi:uncharacterized protein (TIGR02611 family)
MLEGIKQNWHEFRQSEPGHRFQEAHDRRQRKHEGHTDFMKPVLILLGAVLAIGGLVLMPAPGPGMIVVVLGLALIGSVNQTIARLLDKGELRVRALTSWAKQRWKDLPTPGKVVLGVLVAAVLAVGGYMAYRLLFA